MDLPEDISIGSLSEPPAHVYRVPSTPVTEECITKIADHYKVPSAIIKAIAKTEGGQVGKVVYNAPKNYDISLMQINNAHMPRLTKVFGVTESDITYHGCVNYAAATLLIREALDSVENPRSDPSKFVQALSKYHRWKEDKHKKAYEKKLRINIVKTMSEIR